MTKEQVRVYEVLASSPYAFSRQFCVFWDITYNADDYGLQKYVAFKDTRNIRSWISEHSITLGKEITGEKLKDLLNATDTMEGLLHNLNKARELFDMLPIARIVSEERIVESQSAIGDIRDIVETLSKTTKALDKLVSKTSVISKRS